MLNETEMDDHSYFVGPMYKGDTYNILKKKGDFLVRIEPQSGKYVLSLHSSPDIHHFEVLQNQNGDFYLETTRLFENPCDLIKSYRHDKGVLPSALMSSRGASDLVSPECFACAVAIPKSDLLIIKDKKLGAGSFGEVYQAVWRKRMFVAIKEMNAKTISVDEFKKEAEIMTKLRHPNLVTMYGIEETSSTIRIVLEYMNNGSLLHFLHNNRETLKRDNSFLVSAVVQVLKGMEYISRRGYVHRDLAARNCLIRGSVVKVADFGLTRFLKNDGVYPGNLLKGFPLRWSPPEVLRCRQYTCKSDVWSFGVLMWEIFTLGETPYDDLQDSQVVDHVLNGKILPKPRCCDDTFYKWMKSCWSYDPSLRPLFDKTIVSFIPKQQTPITKELQRSDTTQTNTTDSTNNPFWCLGIVLGFLIIYLGYSLISSDNSESKQNKGKK